MRLKNKISGEIKEFVLFDGDELQGGTTLESLTEEWEDVPEEEIQVYFEGIQNVFMGGFGRVYIDYATAKEAEKAVRKLKALKRLENKGFKFDGYDVAHNSNGDLCGQLFYNAGDYCIEDVEKDLDLLFGGEE